MFAILSTGGKQYKVNTGEYLKVEKLDGTVGKKISFDNVLLSGNEKATSLGKGSIEAEIVEQGKGDKVIIFKKKRRQNYRRKNGHRQQLTTLLITSISNGKDVVKFEPKKTTKETSEKTKEAEVKKPATNKVAKKDEIKKEG